MTNKTEKYRFVQAPNHTGQIKWKGVNAKTLKLNDTIEVVAKDKSNETLAYYLANYFVAVVAVESDGIKLMSEEKVKEKTKEKKL